MVFYNWFERFDSFDSINSGLKRLANGLIAKDNSEINCDNAESIEQALQPITDAKTAVRKRIKTLVLTDVLKTKQSNHKGNENRRI